MSLFLIISISFVTCIFISGLLYIKGFDKKASAFLIIVSLLLAGYNFLGILIFKLEYDLNREVLFKIYSSISILLLWSIIESLNRIYIRVSDSIFETFRILPISRPIFWRSVAGLSIGLIFAFIGTDFRLYDSDLIFIINGFGVFHYIIKLVFIILIIYILESIYRWAKPYQRRANRITLLSLLVISIFSAVFSIRIITLNYISKDYIDAGIIVYSIFTPVAFLGLMRYHMIQYKIHISRETVYSSFTFLISGALLFVLGLTIYCMKYLGLKFSHYEQFILIFSALVFIIFIVTSEEVRKRIARIINRHLYNSTYDYKKQFFNLHETYLAGKDITESINILIDNLKYSAYIGDVYVFLYRQSDGNYYLHKNPDSERHEGLYISGDSSIISLLKDEKGYIDLETDNRIIPGSADSVFKELEISSVFPILEDGMLSGFLGINKPEDKSFNLEDTELINAFAVSIGNAYNREKILKESIEHKQFKSFSRIAAFIIHDIKNQVSTLSMLNTNAKKNIDNPDFQKSLLSSLEDCTANLNKLINKLNDPIKYREEVVESVDINRLIKRVTENMGIDKIEGINFEISLNASINTVADSDSLSFVVKNLLINSIEAMQNSGTLKIISGNTAEMNGIYKGIFRIGKRFIEEKPAYIIISDTGPGMSREYMENHLFHPFSSTKDKGIGIGLYQCKTIIEKFHGNILCHSDEGSGTQFCIFLKGERQ